MQMQKEQDRKRVVLDYVPAKPQLGFVPYSCTRQKENLGVLLDAEVEIDIFHCGERVSFIESIDLLKQFSPDGKVAGPEITACFICRNCIREAACLPRCADSSFKYADSRISHCGIPIDRNQIPIRDAVIVQKNQKLSGGVCSSTISVGGRATVWSVDNLNDRHVPLEHLPGYRRISVIADDDRTIRVSADIGNEPAQAPPKQLMPVPGGDDDSNARQNHKW